ncbi:VOC family protein [Flavobacterium sp. MK4S-17]|uniref:VOC family protein n=1 Tax=Flavobacterium sp. MK4S-17 TaxID=2543737 RepID=UPI001359BEA3|nr:VOC family protein [Flavobacterium sp. MK4S-17]
MKILELEILSDNLAETERFYKNVLGLKPYHKDDASTIIFKAGYTSLVFRKSENLKPVYHFAFDVPNNRFYEAYETIKAKTPVILIQDGQDIADFTNWDARSFYFYDNNGNIVEIITRYANKVFAGKPFGASNIICVSEIGLVIGKVPQFADMLYNKFGVPIFHRQPRSEKFTVSGDDDGLFILAESGRNWYPTQVKAYSYRTRILFINNGAVGQFIK